MDQNALILLAAGRDRPGIVERLSGVLYAAGCNLEDSRMSILGGEFALIVLVTGAPESLRRAAGELEDLASEMELMLQVKPTRAIPALEPRAQPAIPYHLHAVALDHPGIVHKVTRLLSRRGINVARLGTRIAPAPVSGAPVFSLEIEAQVPAELSVAKLRSELQELADAESIDIELRPGALRQ
jgi:glycine cleavage system transcriptional repressor